MAAKVLDSWALLALFKGEPAGKAVADLLTRATADQARLLLCVINWGEVYTRMYRAGSKTAAESAAGDLARLPIELIPVEEDLVLTRLAATYKATRKMSYGDCFA